MEIVTLGGREYILAAYTCTPLVTIPLDSIRDGAHVSGKTIAELGYGNTPIDFISYMAKVVHLQTLFQWYFWLIIVKVHKYYGYQTLSKAMQKTG